MNIMGASFAPSITVTPLNKLEHVRCRMAKAVNNVDDPQSAQRIRIGAALRRAAHAMNLSDKEACALLGDMDYEWMVGPIPEGMQLDHLCRRKDCVNPHHLEPVTRAENQRRVRIAGPFKPVSYCRNGHALAAENARRTYLSVCSGIEAATVAWHPLGWQPWAFAEVEAFPSAVLAHHYPNVPNLGDLTQWKDWPDAAFDVLVGGTPCQSFSVAGLRKGLDDPRGGLLWAYLAVARRYRPRWVVWENVPGILSIDGGRAFGALLGGLAGLGYGVAYRVLDAQYFGLAQRRRRVFVVGCLGDWRRAAAVLFERDSLRGDSAARGKARKGVAALTATGVGTCGADDNQAQAGHLIAATVTTSPYCDGDEAGGRLVAHTLRGEVFDASEDGTGRGTPLVPVAYRTAGDGAVYEEGDRCAPLTTNTDPSDNILAYQCQGSNVGPMGTLRAGNGNETGGVPFVPLAIQGRAQQIDLGVCGTLDTVKPHAVLAGPHLAVRRLTPRECERLQGFPDDYTLITYRGKPAADGPRYKALGNSFAVPVVRWIGRRIAAVEAL